MNGINFSNLSFNSFASVGNAVKKKVESLSPKSKVALATITFVGVTYFTGKVLHNYYLTASNPEQPVSSPSNSPVVRKPNAGTSTTIKTSNCTKTKEEKEKKAGDSNSGLNSNPSSSAPLIRCQNQTSSQEPQESQELPKAPENLSPEPVIEASPLPIESKQGQPSPCPTPDQEEEQPLEKEIITDNSGEEVPAPTEGLLPLQPENQTQIPESLNPKETESVVSEPKEDTPPKVGYSGEEEPALTKTPLTLQPENQTQIPESLNPKETESVVSEPEGGFSLGSKQKRTVYIVDIPEDSSNSDIESETEIDIERDSEIDTNYLLIESESELNELRKHLKSHPGNNISLLNLTPPTPAPVETSKPLNPNLASSLPIQHNLSKIGKSEILADVTKKIFGPTIATETEPTPQSKVFAPVDSRLEETAFAKTVSQSPTLQSITGFRSPSSTPTAEPQTQLEAEPTPTPTPTPTPSEALEGSIDLVNQVATEIIRGTQASKPIPSPELDLSFSDSETTNIEPDSFKPSSWQDPDFLNKKLADSKPDPQKKTNCKGKENNPHSTNNSTSKKKSPKVVSNASQESRRRIRKGLSDPKEPISDSKKGTTRNPFTRNNWTKFHGLEEGTIPQQGL